jgi:hypothetical protein
MSIDDVDVERLLDSPALVGAKTVWVSGQCVRRHCERRRDGHAPWQVQLQLRQLLETGHYRRSAPAWVPAEIAVFDAYVELKDGREVVGLVQCRDDPRTFRAVSWFERACLEWAVLLDDAVPRSGALRVDLSAHCVARYLERIVRGGSRGAARKELGRVVQCGRLLPELPRWCERRCSEIPAYVVIVNEWLVLPLRPSTRPAPDVFVATTCFYRGMREHDDQDPRQALLASAKLRLYREELLRLAGGPLLPRAA